MAFSGQTLQFELFYVPVVMGRWGLEGMAGVQYACCAQDLLCRCWSHCNEAPCVLIFSQTTVLQRIIILIHILHIHTHTLTLDHTY